MAFARHKRSPPKYEPRKVTPLFIKQVQAALKANDVHNTQHKLKKGEPGYRPSSHQDLADMLEVDPNAIKNLMGGVRAGTKAKRPGRSRLVDPICELLGIERIVDVAIPESSLSLVERIGSCASLRSWNARRRKIEQRSSFSLTRTDRRSNVSA